MQTPKPDTIGRLGSVPFLSLAMVAGMQLDVFTPLGRCPMTAREVADALGVGATRLEPLLYALVAAELLTFDDGRFANTPESDHYLVKGKASYLGDRHFHYAARYHEVMQTAETIRTGVPQVRRDFTTLSADEFETFLRGIHPGARTAGRELLARVDLSGCRRLADVGGGSGGISIELAAALPSLHITLLDLEPVIPIAQRIVGEAGVGDRVEARACDVVSGPIPGRYDAAVLRSLIQVLSRESAQRALIQVSEALEPGAPIFVIGQIIDDSRVSPPDVVAFNLVFINQHDGQAYTEGEYRAWMRQAGFEDIAREPLSSGASLMRGLKRSGLAGV